MEKNSKTVYLYSRPISSRSSRRSARRNGPRGNKGSCFMPGATYQPTSEEIQYLEAAEYGDIPTVGRLLAESKTLNVNCVDYMGQNALQLSCGNEHLEIVELLLKQPSLSRIGDALLLAISRGFLRITEAILNHSSFKMHGRLTRSPSEQKNSDEQGNDFYAYDDNGTRFSPDITPIILAAQCQEFDIVHELLRRGAKIEHPHHLRCQCSVCVKRRTSDSLTYCLSRLNAYKGLASPAYLALSTPYPAKQAFKLSHELKKLATKEKEFKNDYLRLAQQCNDFVERLLDACHNTEEVNAMLNGHEQIKNEACFVEEEGRRARSIKCTGDTESNPKIRQLRMAIKYKVKKFVAHPYCQQKLIEIWYKNTEGFTQRPVIQKVLAGALLSFLLPIFALTYLAAPCSKIGKALQSPYCKFVTQALAYVQFVLLLVINCMDRMEGFRAYSPHFFLTHQSDPAGRYTRFNWCEITIMIFITGLLWNEMKELWADGVREYMFKLWNVVDSCMLIILIMSFTARAVAYSNASLGQEWWREKFGANATLITCASSSTDNYTLYGDDLKLKVPKYADYYAFCKSNRAFWDGTDPQLVAEALYSLGIVLSFSRISYILEVNDKFGPLQISLARTVGDILKWCGIFVMIFGSFLMGLFNLYSYYSEEGAKKTKSFTTVEETFITLFWSLFGLSDFRVVEVSYNHQVTRITGYWLYGAYSIITVVIMLNMLIAMINSSYSEVEGDSDVEWKFARADMMLSYFEKGNTLPVPYNLLPVPKVIFDAIAGFFEKFRYKRAGELYGKTTSKKPSTQDKNPESAERIETAESSSIKKFKTMRFESVMARIVKRYILKAQVDKSKEAEITEAELQEIKHDISSLRYEMLGSTSRSEEKINDLWLWLRSKNRSQFKPQSSFEESESLEAIIEQREEEYDNTED